jgi:tetratricopeptide (TPR) repeat protein
MDNPPLSSLISQGKQAYQSEQYDLAASYFEQAASEYARLGDELNAAEMANNRSVALLMNGNPQAALQAVLGTDQVFSKAGDLRRQGMALANQAAALEGLKNDSQALDLYQQAQEILKQCGEVELRAQVLQSISALQLRTGKQVEAMASMKVALNNKPRLSLKDRFLKGLIDQVFSLLHR